MNHRKHSAGEGPERFREHWETLAKNTSIEYVNKKQDRTGHNTNFSSIATDSHLKRLDQHDVSLLEQQTSKCKP